MLFAKIRAGTKSTYLPKDTGGGDTGGGAVAPESEQDASARPATAARKAITFAIFIVSLFFRILNRPDGFTD